MASNPKPRKLIVCIDGTSNHFGEKNTNVVELYSRITKDDSQLTYYNSGIGTYARPFWWSLEYQKQQFLNRIDEAIAWNFEKILLGAYRWLADVYRPGDQIFLFGFSRGAYQVRTLAAMIERVGLIYPGNQEQIPFAWAIYSNDDSLQKKFKEAFCRAKVDLHFVGVWDTVASVGLLPRKPFPLTDKCGHIAHFRHALALDELRVKFLPEHVSHEDLEGGVHKTLEEVWFAGTHSDIGGGNKVNSTLDRGGEPLKWMMEQAHKQGLAVRLYDVKIGIPHAEVTDSMRWKWLILEILPISWKTYSGSGKSMATSSPATSEHESDPKSVVTRKLHLQRPREVLHCHSIHWTVKASLNQDNRLDKDDHNKQTDSYSPKAIMLDRDGEQVPWKEVNKLELKCGDYSTTRPTLDDGHGFTNMVNLIKEEPKQPDDAWFLEFSKYASDNDSEPHVIWAYGGPQFLQRLIKNYPNKPGSSETVKLVRKIIGFDPDLTWDAPQIKRETYDNKGELETQNKMAENLRNMVIPRISLLLDQWKSPEPKFEQPKEDRWTWLPKIFWFRRNAAKKYSVDELWNWSSLPKHDRSHQLLCAVVDIITDVANARHVPIPQEGIEKLAIQVTTLLPEKQDENSPIVSNIGEGTDKAALVEVALKSVEALFQHSAAKEYFHDDDLVRRLKTIISGSETNSELVLHTMRTISLLSQHFGCGGDISNANIIPELLKFMPDKKAAEASMEQRLASEASATMAAVSEHPWCGQDLHREENLGIMFGFLEKEIYVNDILRVLKNVSNNYRDGFSSEHVEILSRYMKENASATFTLAKIAPRDEDESGKKLRKSYDHNGVTNIAVELLSHPQEAQVQAAAYLLRNLIEQEFQFAKSSAKPPKESLLSSQVSSALATSLRVSSRSQAVTDELLATAIRFSLREPLSHDALDIVENLASSGNKRAILAASAAYAYDKKQHKNAHKHIPTLYNLITSGDYQFPKESMEVLTILVKKGYKIQGLYAQEMVNAIVVLLKAIYAGTWCTWYEDEDLEDNYQDSTALAALNLVEAMCNDAKIRNHIIQTGALENIVIQPIETHVNGSVSDEASKMLNRLSQYDDLSTVINNLQDQIEKAKAEAEAELELYRENEAEAEAEADEPDGDDDLDEEEESEETSPLIR